MSTELYEVNDEFIKNLEEQVEQGIDNVENFIDSFEPFKLSEKDFLEKHKAISYVIANKKAELEMIANHKKDIIAKEKSLKNTIEYFRIECDLSRKQRIRLPGFGEKTGDPHFFRAAERTDGSEEIQSGVTGRVQRNCSVFSSCKCSVHHRCFSEIHCHFLLSADLFMTLSVTESNRLTE